MKKKIFTIITLTLFLFLNCSKEKDKNFLIPLILSSANGINENQNNGSIAGEGNSSQNSNNNQNNEVNLNAGILDESFGNQGIFIKDIFTYDMPYKIAILNNKIYLAGICNTGSSPKLCIIKLNGDLSLDTSFKYGNFDGVSMIDLYSSSSYGYGDFIVLPDGKFLINGNDNRSFYTFKVNTNGIVDGTFGISGFGGKSFYNNSNYDLKTSKGNVLKLQSDGKFYVGGTCSTYLNPNSRFCLFRFNSNGKPDDGSNNDITPSDKFGFYGVSSELSFGEINDIDFQQDNKIIVAFKYNYNLTVARYNIDGSKDNGNSNELTPNDSFGSNGMKSYNISGDIETAYKIKILPDGKILIAGICSLKFCLLKLNPDGTKDPTFGNNGEVITNFNGNHYIVTDLKIQIDNKIILAGHCRETNYDFCLVRFNSNGTIDTSFGNQGIVVTDISGNNDYLYSIEIQNDHTIIAAGYCYNNNSKTDICLAKYK
ncbi:MAG: hypothetical protein KatS3mg129_0411 [Leptospiraceae bacterium]|nr:MAG: hypothetical protein KatS3mg129_0411 [Leptospiraceae bacterium]